MAWIGCGTIRRRDGGAGAENQRLGSLVGLGRGDRKGGQGGKHQGGGTNGKMHLIFKLCGEPSVVPGP